MTRLFSLGLSDRQDRDLLRIFRARRDAVHRRPHWRYERGPETIAELITDAELQHEGHIESPIYRGLYRTTCTPDREWQRAYLEALRYKWRYRGQHTTQLMQTLHAIGEDALPRTWKDLAWLVGWVVLLLWLVHR